MATQDQDDSPLSKFDAPVLRGIGGADGALGAPRTTFLPTNFAEAMELAKIMSAGTFVPARMRGKPGDCLAVLMQACRWGMDPFAVAQKVYFVNDSGVPGYEAQLVAAVINSSGRLKESLHVHWDGEGDNLRCTVSGNLKGESREKVVEQQLRTISTRNSPLWKQSPRQQLGYYTQRLWCRLYAPEVLLGIYTADEIEDEGIAGARQVGPPPPSRKGIQSAKAERVIQNRQPWHEAGYESEEEWHRAQGADPATGEIVDAEVEEVDERSEEEIARELDAGTSIPGDVDAGEDAGDQDDGTVEDRDFVNKEATKPKAEEPKGMGTPEWNMWLRAFEKQLDECETPKDVEALWSERWDVIETAPDGFRNRINAFKEARLRKVASAEPKTEEKPAEPRKRAPAKPKADDSPPPTEEETETAKAREAAAKKADVAAKAAAAEPKADEAKDEPKVDDETARADEIIADLNGSSTIIDLRTRKARYDSEIDAMDAPNMGRITRAHRAIEDKLLAGRK